MRYLRTSDLDLVRRIAAEAYSRRRPRRASRPRTFVISPTPAASRVRAYAPWPPAPMGTAPIGVLHRVLDGLQRWEVA